MHGSLKCEPGTVPLRMWQALHRWQALHIWQVLRMWQEPRRWRALHRGRRTLKVFNWGLLDVLCDGGAAHVTGGAS